MVCRLARLWALLFALGLALLAATPAGAALVWRSGEGWVDESTGAGLSASSSRDQLDIAKKLQDDKRYDDALKAYQSLVRRWPLSFFASEAQFNIGVCLEKKGDFWGAYKAYKKMVEKYPASNFFEQALDREFAIGNLYLAGEPQRIWKIPTGPSMERTIEIFESVIKAAPYGANAAQAQFKIGLAHEQEHKFTEAVDAYTKLLDKYPGNPIAVDAQYQIGYAWFTSANGAQYDQSAAEKAIEAFEDFLVRYPNSEKVSAANAHIETLKSKQTQSSFYIAGFYERQKKYKAAYIYYNDVIRQNPDSDQAKVAKQKIEYLRPLVGQAPDGTAPAKGLGPVAAGPVGPMPAPAPTPAPAPAPADDPVTASNPPPLPSN